MIDDAFLAQAVALIRERAPEWQRDAALCREHPELDWFPAGRTPIDAQRAVCAACLVRDECLAYGLDEPFGVWGGLGPAERRQPGKRPGWKAA